MNSTKVTFASAGPKKGASLMLTSWGWKAAARRGWGLWAFSSFLISANSFWIACWPALRPSTSQRSDCNSSVWAVSGKAYKINKKTVVAVIDFAFIMAI